MKNNLTLKSLLLLSFLAFTVLTNAQKGLDTEQPPPETEIICYAAKKQWVCAPANKKQQAHEKALKLAAQGNQSAEVEIQTMDVVNDFNQQVQESSTENQQTLLEQQVEDFIPREDTHQATGGESQQVETPVENTRVNEQPVSIESVGVITKDENTSDSDSRPQTAIPSSPSNDFADWQANHPEQWSFQVIGTSNRHHLDQFITTNELQNRPHSIVKTTVNSADWWVVLVGLYGSREQALSQRSELPSQLSERAWVRQVKTIDGVAD